MQSVTIKVEDKLAKEIDNSMKPYYSTKTEFIREAIRDKLKQIKKERALYLLKKNFGKSKIKTPLHRDREIREEVGKEFFKKRGF